MRLVIIAAVLLSACSGLCPPYSAPGQCADCSRVDCAACAPALTVNVLDASTRVAVRDATITGATASCSQGQCTFMEGPRTYVFTVEAEGYVGAELSETVEATTSEGCCSCGYQPRIVEVLLERPIR
jgi:hypothetical protein